MRPTSLFATLDTTSRRLFMAEGAGPIVLSDTVGFIRDLPHALVAAFQATLEETAQADLLLHVVDSASPDRDQQIHAVTRFLKEIGALDVPQILVWNKIDLTAASPGVERTTVVTFRRSTQCPQWGRYVIAASSPGRSGSPASATFPRSPPENSQSHPLLFLLPRTYTRDRRNPHVSQRPRLG
jgi:hypothetical protein